MVEVTDDGRVFLILCGMRDEEALADLIARLQLAKGELKMRRMFPDAPRNKVSAF